MYVFTYITYVLKERERLMYVHVDWVYLSVTSFLFSQETKAK